MTDKFDKKDKDDIALLKRREELWDIQSKFPWRMLDKPVQEGWLAQITLNKEAARRKDAGIMNEAILLCRLDQTIRKGGGDMVSKIRKGDNFNKVRNLFITTDHRGQCHYSGPSLGTIKPKLYDTLTEAQRKWFSKVVTEHVSRWGGQVHTEVKYVCNISVHNLAIKVHKRMLNQVQDIDPKVLQEMDYVEWKLQDYYLTCGRDNWYESIENCKTIRRHWKDAIKHTLRGDLDDPQYYSKMKIKRK